jgi:hypothetical protein
MLAVGRGDDRMSTALVMALRESCGYLRDGGYRETARLLTVAADEIERLNERVRVLESGAATPVPAREHGLPAAELPPARRGVNANR